MGVSDIGGMSVLRYNTAHRDVSLLGACQVHEGSASKQTNKQVFVSKHTKAPPPS